MDKNVQSKINKLCSKYIEAAGRVSMLRPVAPPTRKAQRRAEGQLMDVLGDLQDARLPLGAALVRLAYVRSLREVQPQATLGPEQEKEVRFLTKELDNLLGQTEAATLWEFRDHCHRLSLSTQMRSMNVSPELVSAVSHAREPYPLEQHVRASVLSIVEQASVAGTLAANSPDHYNGVQDAA